LLCPQAFSACFRAWSEAVRALYPEEIIAIDGKTLCRSHHRKAGLGPLHIVSAWATRHGLVLGQQATDAKSNEITAIPELLELLMLKGCIVTIDAMGCEKNIARQIIEQGGDYVLALKGNQGNLTKAARSRWERIPRRPRCFTSTGMYGSIADLKPNCHATTSGVKSCVCVPPPTTGSMPWMDEPSSCSTKPAILACGRCCNTR
jgi:hypothetical protein